MQPERPALPNLPKAAFHAVAFGCVLLIVGVSYVAGYRPLDDWRRGVAVRAETVRANLAEAPHIRRLHAEKSLELQELLASVEAVGRRVPERPREGEFLGDVSRVAEANGVTIHDFRRGQVKSAATHSAVSITVEGEGGYRGICGVLDAVAKLPRLASLTKLSVETGPTAKRYEFELRYVLYYGLSAPEKLADTRH